MAVADGREVAAAAGGRTVSTKVPLELVLSVCKVAAMTVRQRGLDNVDGNEFDDSTYKAGCATPVSAAAPPTSIMSFMIDLPKSSSLYRCPLIGVG